MIQFEPVAFVCDDLDVRAVRKESDSVLNDVLERCSGRLYHIYNLVRLSRPEMVSIAVCGGITDGPEQIELALAEQCYRKADIHFNLLFFGFRVTASDTADERS